MLKYHVQTYYDLRVPLPSHHPFLRLKGWREEGEKERRGEKGEERFKAMGR